MTSTFVVVWIAPTTLVSAGNRRNAATVGADERMTIPLIRWPAHLTDAVSCAFAALATTEISAAPAQPQPNPVRWRMTTFPYGVSTRRAGATHRLREHRERAA